MLEARARDIGGVALFFALACFPSVGGMATVNDEAEEERHLSGGGWREHSPSQTLPGSSHASVAISRRIAEMRWALAGPQLCQGQFSRRSFSAIHHPPNSLSACARVHAFRVCFGTRWEGIEEGRCEVFGATRRQEVSSMRP